MAPMQRCLVFGTLALTAAIAYATLASVELPYAIYFKLAPWLGHPDIHKYAAIEHLLVFALFGALFAFAFPNRILTVCCIVFFGAALLEYLQTLTADRHGTIPDASEKIAGGFLGALAAYVTTRWRRNEKRQD
jgi:VanZ family protein